MSKNKSFYCALTPAYVDVPVNFQPREVSTFDDWRGNRIATAIYYVSPSHHVHVNCLFLLQCGCWCPVAVPVQSNTYHRVRRAHMGGYRMGAGDDSPVSRGCNNELLVQHPSADVPKPDPLIVCLGIPIVKKGHLNISLYPGNSLLGDTRLLH